MCSLEPAGYLFGRPIQSELSRHCRSQPRIVRQLTTLQTTRPGPGLLISQGRSVSMIATIATGAIGLVGQLLACLGFAVMVLAPGIKTGPAVGPAKAAALTCCGSALAPLVRARRF